MGPGRWSWATDVYSKSTGQALLQADMTEGGDREVIAVERPRYKQTFRTYIASPWGRPSYK